MFELVSLIERKLDFKERLALFGGILLCTLYVVISSAIPYLVKNWVDKVVEKKSYSMVLSFGFALLLVFLIFALLDLLGAVLLVKVRERARRRIRTHLKSLLFSTNPLKISEFNPGYLAQIVMDDVEIMTSVIVSSAYMIIPALVGLPVSIYLLGRISKLFLTFTLLGFLLVMVNTFYFSRYLLKVSKRRQEILGVTTGKVTEFISGSSTIFLFGVGNVFTKKLERVMLNLEKASVEKSAGGVLSGWISNLVMGGLRLTIVGFGLYSVLSGNLTVAGLLTGVTYVERIWQPLSLFDEINLEIQQAIASFERVKGLEKVFERSDPLLNFPLCEVVSIALENVKVKNGGESNVVPDFIEIRKGEIALIKGESGVGKTSLARILLGISDSFSGKVFIEDDNGLVVPRERAYRLIGYLPQNVDIFYESIYFNVALDDEYSEAKVQEVLMGVGLIELMERRDRILTPESISGGERKRIGIARLLYRDYSAVILDEPFEGLDKETAKGIEELIRKVFANKITIIISHKPLVLGADKIIEVKRC
ncbi:MAG: ABC transporter ATP-binding protein [candidate division WOR-3 bacterium]